MSRNPAVELIRYYRPLGLRAVVAAAIQSGQSKSGERTGIVIRDNVLKSDPSRFGQSDSD